MNISDVDQLLAEKGNLCTSILIPTHRSTRERMKDPKVIKKAVLKAKNLLQHSTWPKEKIQELVTKLDDVLVKIDYLRLQEGLAIFISSEISRIFLLPIPVMEKILIGKKFEIRDLLYCNQFLKTYYLLAVSKKRIRLFKGEGRDIQEIINNDFPRQYAEEYEYARPSLGSSSGNGLKDFERDKSILQETRMKVFLKQADDNLSKYLKGGIPLLVAGVEEALANFEHVTHHLNKLRGKIPGNYDRDAVHPLSEMAWKKMQESIKASQKETLIKLQENIGKKLTVEGIRDVWKVANEGKGLALVVEKDYQVMAYREQGDDSNIFLSPPPMNYEIITDAVEDVIEIVKEKGGSVMIVENGELKNFSRIALLLRYNS